MKVFFKDKFAIIGGTALGIAFFQVSICVENTLLFNVNEIVVYISIYMGHSASRKGEFYWMKLSYSCDSAIPWILNKLKGSAQIFWESLLVYSMTQKSKYYT